MPILNVTHYPGRHCASTAISDLIRFHGYLLTEAMCFGIGEGLGIWYLSPSGTTPSRMLHVRTADLEAQFFKGTGHPFSWEQFDNPEQSEKYLCRRLDEGKPALLRTDIYHLPYYNSSTHFPGHLITVWGYDRREKLFFVTDTERKESLPVPFDKMRLARYSNGGFINIKGDMFAPDFIEFSGDFPKIIRTAIVKNSLALTEPLNDSSGLNALYKMKKEMPGWPEIDDWKWIARFTYQVIEKRGTGGNGFRLMYHDFLRQASGFVPEIAESGLDRMMMEAGVAWRGFATALKEASEENRPDFTESIDKLTGLIEKEKAYHKAALKLG
jgi:hypothetical protein